MRLVACCRTLAVSYSMTRAVWCTTLTVYYYMTLEVTVAVYYMTLVVCYMSLAVYHRTLALCYNISVGHIVVYRRTLAYYIRHCPMYS